MAGIYVGLVEGSIDGTMVGITEGNVVGSSDIVADGTSDDTFVG